MNDDTATVLLDPWDGPLGGLPPFDRATPEAIERAVRIGIDRKRAEIAAIVADPAPPDFANTIVALERAGRDLRRADALRGAFTSTRAIGAMPAVEARLAPELAALDDAIAHDDALFARIATVYAARADLPPEDARLTEVIHDRMVRRGAGLPATTRDRLVEINRAIAAAQARFQANLIADAAEGIVWIDDERQLDGVPDAMRTAAARIADERGRPGTWAIPSQRPLVWAVLQHGTDRALRKRVRDLWADRCMTGGAHDNRAVIAEIARLRGEKARLMGYPSFAHLATAPRMARSPDRAMAQLLATWAPVKRATLARQAELQALADVDGIGPIAAHDWLYYAERLRRQRFGLDAEAVKPYLTLDNVLTMMFDAAGRLHDLVFTARPDWPVLHPDVRVYEVVCRGEPIGAIWFDLLYREGKMRSSWQYELRAAEDIDGRVLPLSNVCSNLVHSGDGPVTMGWEYANVLFHELGHALHMLLSRARYPSLGSMAVEWDLVELPSQLNERWLYDRDLLRRHARHVGTGAPIPDAMIDAIEAAARHERVFSLGVEYLAPAIVDLRLYLAADGGDVDPMAIEADVYRELGMPAAVDPVFRLPHQYHSFTDVYAAGVYSYLWADVMVADVIEAFVAAPGGLYDAEVAARWRDTILTAGTAAPGDVAFRAFRGRDPDPEALLRRFALA